MVHSSVFSRYEAWASVIVVLGLSSCSFQALEHKLNSCGMWAQLLCAMWDLLGPGIEPVSSALVGGLQTTGPPEARYWLPDTICRWDWGQGYCQPRVFLYKLENHSLQQPQPCSHPGPQEDGCLGNFQGKHSA